MNFEVIFDLDEKEDELRKLEHIMSKADFWQKDQEEVSKINQKSAFLRDKIDQWNTLTREIEEAKILAEMAIEEEDSPTLKEVEEDVSRIEEKFGNLELQSFSGCTSAGASQEACPLK